MSFDIVCISARSEKEIYRTFLNYLKTGGNVIVARHPNAEILSNKLAKKINILENPKDSILERMYEAVKISSASNIFLAADDDYLFQTNTIDLANKMQGNTTFSNVRIVTCYCKTQKHSTIEIEQYLNSALLAKDFEFNINNPDIDNIFGYTGVADLVFRNFYPICLDYYTLYNRKKLLSLLEKLIRLPSDQFRKINDSMKLFQFLKALAMILIGDSPIYDKPVYIRGESKKVSHSSDISLRKIVTKNLKKTYEQQVNALYADSDLLRSVTNVLYELYIEYRKDSRLNIDIPIKSELTQYLKTLLEQTLNMTKISVRLNMLELYKEDYFLRVSKECNNGELSRENNKYCFSVNPSQTQFTKNEMILKGFSKAWPNFILDNLSYQDLLSLYDDTFGKDHV